MDRWVLQWTLPSMNCGVHPSPAVSASCAPQQAKQGICDTQSDLEEAILAF